MILISMRGEYKALDLQHAVGIIVSAKYLIINFSNSSESLHFYDQLTPEEQEELLRYIVMNKNISGIARLDDLISAVKRKYEVLQKIREAEGNGHQSQEIQG